MKISVVIPLYNKKETILRAIRSILAQTSLPEEIVVVNDGSTDGSEQLVTKLNHPLVRLVNQSNAGVSAARNKGIAEAKSEWIAFLDADDEWLPCFLERIKDLYSKYPVAKTFATAYFLQYPDGLQRKVILHKLRFAESGLFDNYFEVATHSEPPIHSSSVVIDKELLIRLGSFPIGIRSGEDLLTWARLAVNSVIAYSREALSLFSQNAAHIYREKPNRIPQEPDIVGEQLAIIAKQARNISGIRNYVGHWHKMRASVYLRLGMKKKVLYEIKQSLSFNAINIKIWAYLFLILCPTTFVNHLFAKFRGT